MRTLNATSAITTSFLLAEDLPGTFRQILQPFICNTWHYHQVCYHPPPFYTYCNNLLI